MSFPGHLSIVQKSIDVHSTDSLFNDSIKDVSHFVFTLKYCLARPLNNYRATDNNFICIPGGDRHHHSWGCHWGIAAGRNIRREGYLYWNGEENYDS